MKEFFHGWRRKAGCITLVMACAVFACWMRSFVIKDSLRFPHPPEVIFYVSSRKGARGFRRIDAQIDGMPFRWTTNSLQGDKTIDYRKPVAGFVISSEEKYWRIPYWFLAMPPTLLSAYLILWKPPKAKSSDQPVISNLISN